MTELMTLDDSVIFNLNIIKRGGVCRLKASSWENYQNGLITRADKTQLTILVLSDANAAINYVHLKAADVANWQIVYSSDLETIYDSDD